jgi:hypothetical protein
MLLDLGEPPEYNEGTYYSFRDYAKTLVDVGLVSKEFLEEDRGTVLMDKKSLNLDNGPGKQERVAGSPISTRCTDSMCIRSGR